MSNPNAICRRNVEMINELIKSCLECHAACRNSIDDYSLPTRLIDADTNNELHVRLIQSDTVHPSTVYAALSHVWGDFAVAPFLRTTVSTLQDRQRNIPLSSLPANFHDAVQVIRALGMRYIWIDSLCIVQKS